VSPTIIKNKILLNVISIVGVCGLFLFLINYDPSNEPSNTTINNTPEGTLIFAIQADPQMVPPSEASVYKQTLQNIVKAKPAFLIDLGDIFMIDLLSTKNVLSITSRFTMMKSFYNLLGSIPLYFVMGNHDGEVGWDTLNTKSYRKKYFPNETYDKNYYSFEKEGSLFIVLDPYTYTVTKPDSFGWHWTLGKTQYDWLKATLEVSTAKHKFVFIHQLVGGNNKARGVIQFAGLWEWGGNNTDGSYGFDVERPGWGKPIHQLLLDNKVDIVFKGHDHLYAKQELDGIIYQTVPQPSVPEEIINVTDKEYGYLKGEIISGSGYLKVTVNETNINVDFIKPDGSVADSYSL